MYKILSILFISFLLGQSAPSNEPSFIPGEQYKYDLFVDLIKVGPDLVKLGSATLSTKKIEIINKKPSGVFSFIVKSNEFFIPRANSIDIEAEINKLQKEIDYNKGFLKSVESKLSNDKFVKNAPKQVVLNEEKKMTDTKSKIIILNSKLNSFQKS